MDAHGLIRDFFDIFHKSHKGYLETFGNTGADLGSVAVNRLFAAYNQVVGADFPDGAGQCIGSLQSIRAGKGAVANQDALIHTQRNGFAMGFFGLRRAHGDDGDCAAEFFAQAQTFLQGIHVEGIYNTRHPFANQGVG